MINTNLLNELERVKQRYDGLLAAARAVMANRSITGMSAAHKHWNEKRGEPDALALLDAQIAKAERGGQ